MDYFAWHSYCVTNRNLLIGSLRINSAYKEFTTSVLLQASCTVLRDVTLRGGDLLTQNCTSMTVVKNWVWSLILVNFFCVLNYTNIKIAFKYNKTMSQLTKPVNRRKSLLPLWQLRNLLSNLQHLQTIVRGSNQPRLILRFQEYTRYIKNNNPQPPYAQHFLHNRHEYGPMDKTMTVLKPLNNTSLLTPKTFLQTILS